MLKGTKSRIVSLIPNKVLAFFAITNYNEALKQT